MKKIFVMLLCLLVVLSLAACGEEGKAPTVTKGEDNSNLSDVIPQATQVQQPAAEHSEEEMAPEVTVPEAAVPEVTVPKETVPEVVVPEETVPEVTVPEETTPEQTVTPPAQQTQPETKPEATTPTEPQHTHKYSKTTVAPKCVEQGYTLNTCSCGYSYKSDYIDPPGHSYSQWVIIREPTSTSTGLEERYCANCEHRLTRTLGKLYEPHTCNFAETVLRNPTCEKPGRVSMECSCGQSYETSTEILGHDFVVVETISSCTEDTYTIGICTRCGADETRYIERAPGHNWEETVVEPTCTTDGLKITTCTRCGETTKIESSALGHKMYRETCQSYAYCTVCGEQGFYMEHDIVQGGSCRYCRVKWCTLYGHATSTADIYCVWAQCGEVVPEVVEMVEDILGRIITTGMTEFQKVKAIHDYIINNTEYDYENYRNDTIPGTSYTPRGVLEHGVAVCDGYARTFMLLCEYADIACERVSGYGYTPEGHAWNQVRIDGKWYNIDVCWDDPVSDRPILDYKYFLLSDELFYKSHSTTNAKHVCDETYPEDGFKRNALY